MNKLALIIPDAMVASPTYQNFRQQLTKEFTISIVSLSPKTFYPYTNSKSSLLYLSAKKENFLNYCADYQKGEWKQVPYSELAKNNWIFRDYQPTNGQWLLSDILEQVKPPPVIINPEQKYAELTVRTNGKGVKRRIKNKQDYLLGSQIKSNRYLALVNCLIVSKIDARNGAIGVIPASLVNSLISNNFLLFQLKEKNQQLTLSLLVAILTSPFYQKHFESLSCGTTNRRSLSLNDFLHTKIAIPKTPLLFQLWQEKEKLVNQVNLLNQNIKQIITTNLTNNHEQPNKQ